MDGTQFLDQSQQQKILTGKKTFEKEFLFYSNFKLKLPPTTAGIDYF